MSSLHLIELSEQFEKNFGVLGNKYRYQWCLVSVHYTHIVAKSNRLKILLSENSKSPTESIKGAKFIWESDEDGKEIQKHVFTHYISLKAIEKAIEILSETISVIEKHFNGNITSEDTEKIAETPADRFSEFSKSNFLNAVVDGFYVESFDIDRATEEITEESIITIYQTGIETKKLLSKFGIHIVDERIIDGTTLRLNPDEAKLLYNNASYLIAMSITDFSQLTRDEALDDKEELSNEENLIPHPINEPVIGVIDTHFNEKVYFHEWVEYKNLLDPIFH